MSFPGDGVTRTGTPTNIRGERPTAPANIARTRSPATLRAHTPKVLPSPKAKIERQPPPPPLPLGPPYNAPADAGSSQPVHVANGGRPFRTRLKAAFPAGNLSQGRASRTILKVLAFASRSFSIFFTIFSGLRLTP